MSEVGGNYVPTSMYGGRTFPGFEPFAHRRIKKNHMEIRMLSIFRSLIKSERGATAIEYTLIAALISVAAIVAMQTVGGKVTNVLGNVANAMT